MKFLWINGLIILQMWLILGGCHPCKTGKGDIIEMTLDIKHFREVKLSMSADIYISQGAYQKVIAKGHRNVIEALNKEVSGENWQINRKGDDCYTDYELSIYITISNLDEVHIGGSGDVFIDDFSDQYGDLSLSISGSGDIKLGKFEGIKTLSVQISGSGDIEHKDQISSLEDVDINIMGSGDYNGYRVKTQYCSIDILGSGNVFVSVDNKLHVNITGSGDVFYRGDPYLKENIVGSGTVKKTKE